MKGKTWLSVLLLAFVSVSFLSLLGNSQTAEAWAGTLPDCNNLPGYDTLPDYSSSLASKNTDPSDTLVVFRREWGGYPAYGAPILVVGQTITIGGTGGQYAIGIGSGSRTFTMQAQTGELTDVTYNVGSWSPTDLTCISDAKNVEYSTDYDGHLYDGPAVPNLNSDISMYWKTEDKLVTLVHKTKIPPLNLETMTCRWQFTDEDGNKLLDKVTPCNSDNFQQLTVEDYGTFQVNLDILYDKNNDTVILPDESIGTIQSNIEVYGEFQEGMIGHDWFEVDSDYKDCSSYGTDVVGGIGCHFFNFGLRIRDFFVPDSAALAREFREFNGYMEVKLGFVWQAFAMPIELLGDMVTGFASPTCSLSLGDLSGQNVSISLCQVRTMVGAAPFDLLLNIFRGAVALGFIFTSARYANQFFSNRSAGQI